jgi:mono/diheme cytochrome c family protein
MKHRKRTLLGVLPLATFVWVVALAFVWGDTEPLNAQPPQVPAAATPASPDSTFLTQYCIGCHNQRAKVAGLALDTLDLSKVGADAETWEKVIKKIRTGMMPPSGARRPERTALDGFATNLEQRLDRAADPNAALVTPALHRLNRTEYANAIRDLLGLDVDVNVLLPADGSSQGFDNLAEALAVSPSLIQGYISAAMKISRLAVGDKAMAPSQTTFSPPPDLAQDRHIEGLPLGTRGGFLIRHTFPLDAEYEFALGGRPGGPGAGIDITLDGEQIKVENPRSFRVKVAAGPHTIGLSLPDRQRGAGIDEIYSDFRVDAIFTTPGGVPNLVVTGPLNIAGVGDTPSRRKIFTCRPKSTADEATCARSILTTMARRAYRGPVSAAESDTLMGFYKKGREARDFESGIQEGLARILVAPRFVYRAEEEPATIVSGQPYRVGDVDLASRLSFFLWSSIPDDELLDVSIKGRLRDPKVLDQQFKRMLADAKADAIVENFAGQWLYLRELDHVQTEARNFDENLRQSFRRETEMLFRTIVRDDRSLIELIDADYTFVDERLARHYGIPNIQGSYFRRVQLPADSPRRGLLGQGSMLTVTSIATRTSPVSRGKWVLENLLGTPAPVPPPGVETNLGGAEAAKTSSLRQRLEAHRASPVCASCHRIMDPIGLALENFDLVGRWRDTDNGKPVDTSAMLIDGTPVRGVADLRAALLAKPEVFVTALTEKLLTYALGRVVDYRDQPTVRAIVRAAAPDGYKFDALVRGIVASDAFRKRSKHVEPSTATLSARQAAANN